MNLQREISAASILLLALLADVISLWETLDWMIGGKLAVRIEIAAAFAGILAFAAIGLLWVNFLVFRRILRRQASPSR